MAIYDNLPVYKASYDLILTMFKLNRHLQRDYRFTLGETTIKELVALMLCIYKANSIPQKSALISRAREHVVVIKLHIQLLMDLHQITIKQYAAAAELIESISKQLAAWHKSVDKKENSTETNT